MGGERLVRALCAQEKLSAGVAFNYPGKPSVCKNMDEAEEKDSFWKVQILQNSGQKWAVRRRCVPCKGI